MIVYPAVDMRGGKVVRLREGDPDRQTTYSDDPAAVVRGWVDQGAEWVHMVNLDGAFGASSDALTHLGRAASTGVNIQFGGGLRQLSDMEAAINGGAARIVLGTIALLQPEIVTEAIQRWGADRVCVGLDARDGKVTTHGWSQTSMLTPVELGARMADRGVIHALYTDVNKDGGLGGGSSDATIALARATGLRVIASGGISTRDEIRALVSSGVVSGVIIGMALYEGKLTLTEALNAARTPASPTQPEGL